MLKTPEELRRDLADRLKTRRVALGWTQRDAAVRAGVAYRTWRRLEGEGAASIDDLVRASFALRCEDSLEGLFPPPVAASLDDLLQAQAKTRARGAKRARVRS